MILVLAMLFATVPNASAISIVRNFIADGNTFPIAGGVAGAAPGDAVGGGNLIDIFNAAADWWELALRDVHFFVVNFGWASLSGGTLGITTQPTISQPGSVADIQFDNDSTVWFTDSTPDDNSEYDTFTESEADLGGGLINTGRVYTNPNIAEAANFDLFSVALHEIGHALGIADFTGSNFTTPTLTTTAPRPNDGTVISTTSTGGGHIDIDTSLMYQSIGSGMRRMQSGVDILAVAEVDGFTDISLNPQQQTTVPEPGTLALMGIGFFGLLVVYRRKKK